MRGLVVVALILLFGYLAMGSPDRAVPKSVVPPFEANCTLKDGTYVTVTVNVDAEMVEVDGVCKKYDLPAGWSVYCYTEDTLDSVNVKLQLNDRLRETTVICS